MLYVYPFPIPLVLWKTVMIITAAIQEKKVLKVWDAILMIAKYSLKYRHMKYVHISYSLKYVCIAFYIRANIYSGL